MEQSGPIMHTEYITDVINSGYKNTANWIIHDYTGRIVPEYLDGSDINTPGTYVWVSDNSSEFHQSQINEVLYIGEYGFTVKDRMEQHWRSWPRTTRSNQKQPEDKPQKGDIIMEHLEAGKTVKIYSKPAPVVHIQTPHPLKGHQTDVPDMLRLDTKSNDEANLLDAFIKTYGTKPQLNGTKGSKGFIITEGYNYSASMPEADVNSVAPENRARPDGYEFNKIQDKMRGMYIPEHQSDGDTGC